MNFFSALSFKSQKEQEREEKIRLGIVPKHIAIIMDGNRRWAKRNALPASVGHWRGADTLRMITEVASRVGVKTLTVYSFSTENWNRGADEVAALMDLFENYLERERRSMVAEGVRLGHIGNVAEMPASFQKKLFEIEQETKHGEKITLVLALNYGGRDEIKRSVQSIAEEVLRGDIAPSDITEETIERHLDTAVYGSPDLLVRTSGELRISNFLLWQISYAELYVTKKLWPEFSKEEFFQAIEEYQKRERRLGG